jgi:predicted lipase
MKKQLLLVFAGALFACLTNAAYSQTTAIKSVYYSAAAHCSASTLKSWTCGVACQKDPGVTNVTPVINNAKGTYGFVGYNTKDNQIVVSFRGSVNTENWITNLDYIQTPYKSVPGAQVHEGFYTAYTAVSSQVINAVKALKTAHPTATYLITGHSLGGALATFAGVDIKTTLGVTTTMSMYTFGSPRTGNQAFSDFVFKQFSTQGYQRLTHYNDVVPHLPPTEFGFNHAGNEVWQKNAGTDLTIV